MPANRKPKKRYDPHKAMRRLQAIDAKKVQSQAAKLMQAPLDDGGMQQLQTFIHASFEAIRMGVGTVDDLSNLELCAMLTTVICASGIGLEDLTIGEDARVAVGTMVERYKTHNRVIFAGREMGDIAHMLELHDIQMEHMTKAKMIECLDASAVLLREQGERYEAEQKSIGEKA